MSEQVSPFKFVDAISASKRDLLRDGEARESDYNSFVINKTLSYFPDAIYDAQQMNMSGRLDAQLQFDYLRLSLRKKRRITKWGKAGNSDDVRMIAQWYGYSLNKAREALHMLTDAQLQELRNNFEKGGKK